MRTRTLNPTLRIVFFFCFVLFFLLLKEILKFIYLSFGVRIIKFTLLGKRGIHHLANFLGIEMLKP
jgi:hypothetical protein